MPTVLLRTQNEVREQDCHGGGREANDTYIWHTE